MHPLAQYVDLIALLAYLLDPLALFFGHLTKRKNGSKKKMLTESQFARFMMFSTTCGRRSQALISINSASFRSYKRADDTGGFGTTGFDGGATPIADCGGYGAGCPAIMINGGMAQAFQ